MFGKSDNEEGGKQESRGSEPSFDDGNGHLMQRDLPLPVCDKTAGALESLERDDLTVTPSTWHYAGGGCC